MTDGEILAYMGLSVLVGVMIGQGDVGEGRPVKGLLTGVAVAVVTVLVGVAADHVRWV